MRAKKQLGIVVSGGAATLGTRAKPSGSFSHGSAIVSRASSPSCWRPALTVTIGQFTISIGQFPSANRVHYISRSADDSNCDSMITLIGQNNIY